MKIGKYTKKLMPFLVLGAVGLNGCGQKEDIYSYDGNLSDRIDVVCYKEDSNRILQVTKKQAFGFGSSKIIKFYDKKDDGSVERIEMWVPEQKEDKIVTDYKNFEASEMVGREVIKELQPEYDRYKKEILEKKHQIGSEAVKQIKN